MIINSRIEGMKKLGQFMAQFKVDGQKNPDVMSINEVHYDNVESAIHQAKILNGWFTEENVRSSFSAWGESLTEEKLNIWLGSYDLSITTKSKSVGIIMAGNIPLVGFHDFLTTVLSGHKAVIKLASDDSLLMPLILEVLTTIDPEFSNYFEIVDRLISVDAVIATGSNNSARYFEHYFGKYPHIIRKNRTSLAVLTGEETKEDLEKLGRDMFLYFGLGCRNVSKIYLPKNFDINRIFEAIYPYNELANHNKYANNYDYNKAIYLLNKEPLLENGFVLFREAKEINSPVAVMLYERYADLKELKQTINAMRSEIQCVVTNAESILGAVPFGKAQHPDLWDYADGVDTMEFLLSL